MGGGICRCCGFVHLISHSKLAHSLTSFCAQFGWKLIQSCPYLPPLAKEEGLQLSLWWQLDYHDLHCGTTVDKAFNLQRTAVVCGHLGR